MFPEGLIGMFMTRSPIGCINRLAESIVGFQSTGSFHHPTGGDESPPDIQTA